MTTIGKGLTHEIIRRCPLVIYVGIFIETDALLLKPHVTVKDAFLPACVSQPKIFLYLKAVAMGPQMAWVPVYAWRASGLSSRPFTLNPRITHPVFPRPKQAIEIEHMRLVLKLNPS